MRWMSGCLASPGGEVRESKNSGGRARAEMQARDVISDASRLHDCYLRVQRAEAKVERLYARWAELEQKQA